MANLCLTLSVTPWTLAFARECWMLILDFGHPRAMVSQFFKSPWLWDGIRLMTGRYSEGLKNNGSQSGVTYSDQTFKLILSISKRILWSSYIIVESLFFRKSLIPCTKLDFIIQNKVLWRLQFHDKSSSWLIHGCVIFSSVTIFYTLDFIKTWILQSFL